MLFFKKNVLTSLFFIVFIPQSMLANKKTNNQKIKAITIVPVADLTLQRIAALYPEKKTVQQYQINTLEGKKTSARSCPRVHQTIFNEQVKIIKEQGDEVLVEIPNVFYITHANKQVKQNRYWSHKKNFLKLNALKKKGINTKHFPEPICFVKNNIPANKNIVTLIFPFFDATTKQTFSVGTRFVRAENQPKKNHICVWALNPTIKKIKKISIPKKYCLISYPKNKVDKKKYFVNLLKKWSHLDQGFVPYVWGGCSFTKPYKKNMITKKIMHIEKGKKINSFVQNDKKNSAAGFDCTGAVCRAAQIAGIPYFFKNSFTAEQNLSTIKTFKELQSGDVLYFSGHIMIVSDIKNNTILEARTHEHGFGKLHEAKLETIFDGIKTYQKLFNICKKNKKLKRLDKNKKVCAIITSARFLKIPSY